MTDQVLSDEEKDALLEGVEKGDVEVQSASGPTYARVQPFVVTPRNHIVTNSFPRLQSMNRKLGAWIGKAAQHLLNDRIEAEPGTLETPTWGEFREQWAEPAVLFEFQASPLEGSAVVVAGRSAVLPIVERFYGGSDDNPPRHEAEGFTRGEMNVVALFCQEVLKGIEETWAPIIELEARPGEIYQSTDVVDLIEDGEQIIACEFELTAGEETQSLHVVWPMTMIASLVPVLEGQKRDRDAAEDARWESSIRGRVPEALVNVNSCVGTARLSLRRIASLEVGDVIDLDNPRKGTVFTNDVAVIEGRFGVHDGRYAIEATRWLTRAPAS